MVNRKTILLLMPAFIFFSTSFCQTLSFNHLTAASGLSSELINTIAEDEYGRIWMGTDNGLNVFDAYEVKSFYKTDNTGLLSDRIYRLCYDRHGRLWVGTDAGINMMEAYNGRFVKPAVKDNISITTCNTIHESKEYGLVFSTPQGYFYYNEKTNLLEKIDWLSSLLKPEPLRMTNCTALKEDEHVFIFANQFVIVDFASHKILFAYKDNPVYVAAPCGENELLIGKFNSKGLYRINITNGRTIRYEDSTDQKGEKISAYITDIAPCGNHLLALSSRYNGIYFYNCITGRFTNYRHDPSDITSLKSNYTRHLWYARSGNLFVSASLLSYCNLRSHFFKQVTFLKNENGTIYDDVINCFVKDKRGNVWIGTNLYLIKWNPVTNTSHFYDYNSVRPGEVNINTIRGITVDKTDRVWVATYGGGVGVLNEKTGRFIKFVPDSLKKKNSFPDYSANTVFCDPDGDIWALSGRGMSRIDPASFEIENFENDPRLYFMKRKNIVSSFVDSKGNFWLGTTSGAFCLDKNLDSLASFSWPVINNGNIVYALAEDKNGYIYAGTGNGLYIIDLSARKVIKTLGKENGLRSNVIYGLEIDKKKNIWISAGKGIARWEPDLDLLEVFDYRDGVLMTDHRINSSYRSPDGTIFMGGLGGFNYFNPDSVYDPVSEMPTYITHFIFGDSIAPLKTNSVFTVSYNKRNIMFRYLAVDYQLPSAIRYQYRLNNFDTAWVNAGNQREVRYTNLPAGKFSFSVRSSVDGKNWSLSKNNVDFIVKPPFWKTWWFIFICILAACILLYTWIKMREKNIKGRASEREKVQAVIQETQMKVVEQQHKMAEVEMLALRAQMNPHFLFNSLNSINNYILKNDSDNAAGYLTKFSRLMRLILDNSRSNWVLLENEIKALTLYVELEAFRFRNIFTYDINMDDNINPAEVLAPPMIIQPYVENAIWHGLMHRNKIGGHLQIDIYREHENICIRIQDDGIGREAANRLRSRSADNQKSHGMKITGERLEIMNKVYDMNAKVTVKDLYDEAGIATGTLVLLMFKYIIQTELITL